MVRLSGWFSLVYSDGLGSCNHVLTALFKYMMMVFINDVVSCDQ